VIRCGADYFGLSRAKLGTSKINPMSEASPSVGVAGHISIELLAVSKSNGTFGLGGHPHSGEEFG